jgi:quercetin dioxygenase-like cupin family protein/catechol 2,3-dioxygenase-like lactoylglutathione lyase family enzyme
VNLGTSPPLPHGTGSADRHDGPAWYAPAMSDAPTRVAEVCLPSTDLAVDIAWFEKTLGFRLETIFPADDPRVATMQAHGLRLRLDREANAPPPVLRLLADDPDKVAGGARALTAPNGVRVHVVDARQRFETPPTTHEFMVRRLKDQAPWVIGRAGMQYRDLIPGRLGGSIIASHIRIPHAGPVPDMVHYHTVGFQLIFCYRGWVRLVYEDQGPPFVLAAGDCVIQPPEIRHRVLESSEQLQVIEVGVPAAHLTTLDHAMTLPTATIDRDRLFSGQRFCHSLASEARWTPWRIPGFDVRETGIGDATAGVASVQVARPSGAATGAAAFTTHTSDILFTFVLSGGVSLDARERGTYALEEGDAYVIPPGLPTALTGPSPDLTLLEVSLPARFETTIV